MGGNRVLRPPGGVPGHRMIFSLGSEGSTPSPGTTVSDEIAWFVNVFTWKGKVFDPEKGELRNKILPMGHKAIVAKVYKDKSWFDQKECIVLDYSKTSLLAHWIRDEIREVSPGIYLGLVYWGKKKLIHFALQFPASG